MKPLFLLLLIFAAPARAQIIRPKVDKAVLALAALDGSAAFYDVHRTQDCFPKYCYETDPLAKPFISHPAATYALAAIETVGLAALGQKMRHSHRWKRVWWVPQLAGAGLHAWAAAKSPR